MNENISSNLKLIYKPEALYSENWYLLDGIEKISLEKKGKNLYNEFLKRYYYIPLSVIFKDDDLVKQFKYSICSKLDNGVRKLVFSKKTFISNLISNIDEILVSDDPTIYKYLKKAIRDRKDIYRDVYKLGTESVYYKEIKKEYQSLKLKMSMEEYVSVCKKKFTRLLSGFNAVMDFFDKTIDVDKFIKCFDEDKLYLFTCCSLLNCSKSNYVNNGKLDYNVTFIEMYKDYVKEIRKKDSFYNTHVILNNRIYTIDDFFKDYNTLLNMVYGK